MQKNGWDTDLTLKVSTVEYAHFPGRSNLKVAILQ